jgi:3D (Asp-Asp-Asp) domain-containing protein
MHVISFRARATGYYPDSSPLEGGFRDRRGRPLATLQDYLAGRAPYVAVAMDARALPYGTRLVLPAFDLRYARPVEFRVVDTGSAFKGRGLARLDICTADRAAAEDDFLNASHLAVALVNETDKTNEAKDGQA